MAKCKDCEHFAVCKEYDPVVDFDMDDGVCLHFLNKVVRCKDCKLSMLWRKPIDKVIGECWIRKMNSEDEQFCMVGADDFCSYGERREA